MGSVAEWATAVVALLALVAAALSWVASRHANKIAARAFERDVEQRFRAQARLVYTSIEQQMSGPGLGVDVTIDGKQVFEGGDVELHIPPVPPGRWIADANSMFYLFHVHNLSDELVPEVILRLWDARANVPIDGIELRPKRALAPRSFQIYGVFLKTEAHLHQGVEPVIVFRDSDGHWWRRRQTDPIEPVVNMNLVG